MQAYVAILTLLGLLSVSVATIYAVSLLASLPGPLETGPFMAIFLALLMVGVVYAWREGALRWA